MTRFVKGQSGNPAGKPMGAKDKRTELRALLQPHAEVLVGKAVELALNGDTTALRICLDRLIAPVKARDLVVTPGALDGSPADQGRVVLAALSNGRITPDEANTLMQTIAAQSRILAADTIAARLEAIELTLRNRS